MNREMPTLDEVFTPRGVAIVGATSKDNGAYGTVMVQSFKDAGFPAIYPVNPGYTEILGLPCYPSVQSIPGPVDHVIVCIPAESVLALLDDCAAKGVRSVHFFTAGFRESGCRERAELEQAMLARAREGNFRIIGPNCVGLYVPKSRVPFWTGMSVEPGPIGFMSQSGGNAQDLPYLGKHRGLTFSKVVSYGNALDVNECELLEYFTQDPETGIIAAYIEGVTDGRRFLSLLRAAAAQKPVVIYKGGTTPAGSRAVHGHTASLTTSLDVFAIAARQCGAILVDSVEELIDVLVTLRYVSFESAGRGVAIVGGGGGPSVLASDEFEKEGLVVPPLAADIQSELRKHLPFAGSIFRNPVDSVPLSVPAPLARALPVVGRDPEIHMLVYHMGFHPITRWGLGRFSSREYTQPIVRAFQKTARDTGKSVCMVLRPAPDAAGFEEFLAVQHAFASAGVPVYNSMRYAARAIARVLDWTSRAERQKAFAR